MYVSVYKICVSISRKVKRLSMTYTLQKFKIPKDPNGLFAKALQPKLNKKNVPNIKKETGYDRTLYLKDLSNKSDSTKEISQNFLTQTDSL